MSRLDLFKVVAKPRYGYISKVITKINTLNNLGFEQAKACEITAPSVKDSHLRDFLLRFAQSIKVGEDVSEFLLREYDSYLTIYKSEYERSMVRLRRLSEVYLAILSSVILIAVTFSFMGMMWGAEFTNFIWALMLPLALTYALLIIIAYYLTPYDKFVFEILSPSGKGIVFYISKILVIYVMSTIIASVVLTLLNKLSLTLALLIILFSGSILFIFSFYGNKLIKEIKILDDKFATFISTLASSIASLGTTLKDAIKEVSHIDFGPLNKLINKLKFRLDVDIDEEICWKLFINESLSEAINVHVEIFHDSIKAGAPTLIIGDLLLKSILNLQTLRRRREEVSAFLTSMLIPLQPALTVILALTLTIITEFAKFTEFVQKSSPIIQIISPIPVEIIEVLFFIILLMTVVFNSLIVYLAKGEHLINFTYYLGLFLIVSIPIYLLTQYWMKSFLSSLIAEIKGGVFVS